MGRITAANWNGDEVEERKARGKLPAPFSDSTSSSSSTTVPPAAAPKHQKHRGKQIQQRPTRKRTTSSAEEEIRHRNHRVSRKLLPSVRRMQHIHEEHGEKY